MALMTQRYNYKGHDIYVFMPHQSSRELGLQKGSIDAYSIVTMVDGKVLGATTPDAWFAKDSNTYVLEDGVQLHIAAKARIFSESVKVYADGIELVPEERHNRKYENMHRLAKNYSVLGPLTDAQFLAVKSLSSSVLIHTGLDIFRLPAPLKTVVKELNSDVAIKKQNNMMADASLYLIQPGDMVELAHSNREKTFTKGVVEIKDPFEIYYDGYSSLVNSVSIEVSEIHIPNGTRGFSDFYSGSLSNVPFVIDGKMLVGKDQIPVDGCITSIDYRKALGELEEVLSKMPDEARLIYLNALKEIVNESTTLIEYKTVKDLVERGYEITESLLMDIANKDMEWQELLKPRFFDQQDMEEAQPGLDFDRER
jgi:hypothetical protein